MKTAALQKAKREGAKSITTMIRMPVHLRERLEERAARDGRTVSRMAVVCIDRSLETEMQSS